MDLLQSVMDSSTHAIFILNQNGIIDHINEQAKTEFGLFNHSQYSHAAGKLEKDDIVILADTAIGADDGNLRPEDLNVLGIHDKKYMQEMRVLPLPDMIIRNVRLFINFTRGMSWSI